MLKRLKNFLIFYTVAPFIFLLGRLPLDLALALGPALGWLAWVVARRERRRALDNLERAWPDLDMAGRRRLAREVFGSLGRGAMECVAADRVRPLLGGPRSPVSFSPGSLEVLQQALEQGRGVLFATAHLGNWELLGAEVARHAPLSVLFKPSYDARFTGLMTRFRSASGIRGIDVTSSAHMTHVLRALREGEVVGILADQPAPGVWVPFFNRDAPTSTMIPVLANRTGAAVLAGFIKRQGRQHTITVKRLDVVADVFDATARLTREVEQAIREAPSQWVWTLDRWRGEAPVSAPAQCRQSAHEGQETNHRDHGDHPRRTMFDLGARCVLCGKNQGSVLS